VNWLPLLGAAFFMALAPLVQTHLIQPLLRKIDHMPVKWLRRVLLFKIGK
jgi:hypothetical protein